MLTCVYFGSDFRGVYFLVGEARSERGRYTGTDWTLTTHQDTWLSDLAQRRKDTCHRNRRADIVTVIFTF